MRRSRRVDTLFIRLDFLTDSLGALGHDARAFYVNNPPLQLAWLRKDGIAAMSGRERVAILLELLGRKVRVVLDRESVAAA